MAIVVKSFSAIKHSCRNMAITGLAGLYIIDGFPRSGSENIKMSRVKYTET